MGYPRSLAHRTICEDCCSGACLLKAGYELAIAAVEGCLDELSYLSNKEKKGIILNEVYFQSVFYTLYSLICDFIFCRLENVLSEYKKALVTLSFIGS